MPPAKLRALARIKNANVFRIRRDLRLGGGGGEDDGGGGGGLLVADLSDVGIIGRMGAAPAPRGTEVGGAV